MCFFKFLHNTYHMTDPYLGDTFLSLANQVASYNMETQ